MKIFKINALNSPNDTNLMEKKTYSRPTISETKLDSEINLVLMSPSTYGNGQFMGVDESNQTDGSGISQFMNPLKWFR